MISIIANRYDLRVPTQNDIDFDDKTLSTTPDPATLWRTRHRLRNYHVSPLHAKSPRRERWSTQAHWWRTVSAHYRRSIFRGLSDTFFHGILTDLIHNCVAVLDELQADHIPSYDMLTCSIHVLEVWGLALLTCSAEADQRCLHVFSWFVELLSRYGAGKNKNLALGEGAGESVRHWQVTHSSALDRVWDILSSTLIRVPKKVELAGLIEELRLSMIAIVDRTASRNRFACGLLDPSPLMAARVLAKIYACSGPEGTQFLWTSTLDALARWPASDTAAKASGHDVESSVLDCSFVSPKQTSEAVLMLLFHLIQLDLAESLRLQLGPSCHPRLEYHTKTPSLQSWWEPGLEDGSRPEIGSRNQINSRRYSKTRHPLRADPVSGKTGSQLRSVVRILLKLSKETDFVGGDAPSPLDAVMLESLTQLALDPMWPAAHLLLTSITECVGSYLPYFTNACLAQAVLQANASIGEAILIVAGGRVSTSSSTTKTSMLSGTPEYFRSLAATGSCGDGRLSRAVYLVYSHHPRPVPRPTTGAADVDTLVTDDGDRLSQARAVMERSTGTKIETVLSIFQRFNVHPEEVVQSCIIDCLYRLVRVQPNVLQVPALDVDRLLMSVASSSATRERFYRLVRAADWGPSQIVAVAAFTLKYYIGDQTLTPEIFRWLLGLLQLPCLHKELLQSAVAAACLDGLRGRVGGDHVQQYLSTLHQIWAPLLDDHTRLANIITRCLELANAGAGASLSSFFRDCIQQNHRHWRSFMNYVASASVDATVKVNDAEITLFLAVNEADPVMTNNEHLRHVFEECLQAAMPVSACRLIRQKRLMTRNNHHSEVRWPDLTRESDGGSVQRLISSEMPAMCTKTQQQLPCGLCPSISSFNRLANSDPNAVGHVTTITMTPVAPNVLDTMAENSGHVVKAQTAGAGHPDEVVTTTTHIATSQAPGEQCLSASVQAAGVVSTKVGAGTSCPTESTDVHNRDIKSIEPCPYKGSPSTLLNEDQEHGIEQYIARENAKHLSSSRQEVVTSVTSPHRRLRGKPPFRSRTDLRSEYVTWTRQRRRRNDQRPGGCPLPQGNQPRRSRTHCRRTARLEKSVLTSAQEPRVDPWSGRLRSRPS